MFKVFTIILFEALFFVGAEQKNKNYISLEFSSSHTEKPVPFIIFNVDSMVTDNLSFAGYKFKVTQKEFNELENVAKQNCSYLLIDTLAYRYYSVNVIKSGKKSIYGTTSLGESKKLFSKILGILKGRRNFSEISKA